MMDTFQMNPKAICAGMAFPHDMQAFHRMHNIKILPTRPHTPWPNRAEMGARLFKKCLSLGTGGYFLRKPGPDHSGTNHSCQLLRKAATLRNTQVSSSGKDAHGTGHETKTKRSPGPSFHESRTAYTHARQLRPPQ